MSGAIDKDREIAATFHTDPFMKCYDREWRAVWIGPGKAIIVVEDDVPPLIDEEIDPSLAEHIVRLHNRQPLYDKLVNAIRAWDSDPYVHPEGSRAGLVVRNEQEEQILKALAALDEEGAA